MFPAKGSLLIMDYRINQLVLNRCPQTGGRGHPGAGRYHLPHRHHVGSHRDYHKIDQLGVGRKEVEVLLRGIKRSPIMAPPVLLRLRRRSPLVAVDGDRSSRNINRGMVLLDRRT